LGKITTPEESSKWFGLNSFTARLHSESLLVDTTHLAMHELHTALEEELPAREAANCKISAASEWIIRSGMKLYSEASLHNEESRTFRERWQF
jgi:Protein of unknown function (DUF3632)